ncbi:MAG: peptide/nickel transport system ATP-binding protein [Thermomicrobiales bacterium]|jgi:ABC-type dipeptide/oligopeptide/nickel transport system ATPase component|nr:peptide/nickel transport system ATP-binding protein [Thermomicrobiales bacterium]
MTSRPSALISIHNLTIAFPDETGERFTPVVKDVSLTVGRHEILGLVGESGSGKTQTALAILALTRPPGRVVGGSVLVDGEDVVGMDEAELRRVRGKKAAMIFQSPRTSLNPLMTIGDQIGRVYQRHRGLGKSAARTASLAMLRRVGIAGPERVAASYPHQLSGGMAQRVMIGMMVACGPELLIADEPTTGLDVTIQAQIFDLIQEVQTETGMSVLLITHDLGVVAETCHRVAVMQAGRVVEIAPVAELFARPRHPYTIRLLGALLRPDQPFDLTRETMQVSPETVLEIEGRHYRAVSVDSWAAKGVSTPELVEVGPEHVVLCHVTEVGAPIVAGAST